METPQNIISNEQIERVHANANFGSMSKRAVVNEGVLKTAFGYSSGGTALAILHEHGLIRAYRKTHGATTLTKKGVRYLRAVYGPRFDQIKKLGVE